MALTPPTIAELNEFRGEESAYTGPDAELAALVLVQATDALWVFTGLDDLPEDDRQARIVKYAIFDLTMWLMAQYENREEINSPFTTERIGSYSYSKMQQSKKTGESGLYWLDLLFQALRGDSALDADSSWSSSEHVFTPGFNRYAAETPFMRDPSEPWGF